MKNGAEPVMKNDCDDRHGMTKWVIGLIGVLVLGTLATAGGAFTSSYSTSNKFDVLSEQIRGNQESLNVIREDVREIRQEMRAAK